MGISDIQFWHDNLGKHLSDRSVEESCGVVLPTRSKAKGIVNIRLGSGVDMGAPIDYMASPKGSVIIGKLALEDTDKVSFIGKDKEKMRPVKFVAEWIATKAQVPFMVGKITNSSPLSSFRVSAHEAQCYYCEAGKILTFNLEVIRHDLALVSALPWRTVSMGMMLRQKYVAEAGKGGVAEKTKLMKFAKSNPEVYAILPKLKMVQGSSEFKILQWLLG